MDITPHLDEDLQETLIRDTTEHVRRGEDREETQTEQVCQMKQLHGPSVAVLTAVISTV